MILKYCFIAAFASYDIYTSFLFLSYSRSLMVLFVSNIFEIKGIIFPLENIGCQSQILSMID